MAAKDDSDVSTRSCLVMAGVLLAIVGLMIGGIYLLAQRDRAEAAKRRAAELAEDFENARGDAEVHVFLDPTLLVMLADDPDSVKILTELDLSMVDFRDRDMAAVSKLSNVKRVYAYSCHGIENLLSAMQGLPAVEELHFDTTLLSDEGIKLLATFPNLKKVRFNYVAEQERVDLLKSTIPHVPLEIDETE